MIQSIKDFFSQLYLDFLAWSLEIYKDGLTALKDLSLEITDLFLGALVHTISIITPPQLLNSSLNTLFAAIDPSILYFLGQTGVFEGLQILSTAVMFKLTKSLFTFFG